MITEDFVSYEVAKLLKDKGFDETCYACYEYFSSGVTMYSGWSFEYKGDVVHNSEDRIKCPTLQMAMKWLREVQMLHIWIGHNNKSCLPWYYEIHNIKTGMVAKIGDVDCGSYEQACEAAIKYCLESLISK